MGNGDNDTRTCDAEEPIEKTIEHVKEISDGGVDAVMPGGDLWPAVIEKNMKAVADTTHAYGKNPSPAVGRL